MKKFFRTLITILFFTPVLSFAYDAPTTHAGFSQEIVSFYNYSHGDKITDIEKEKIVQGSIDEDYKPESRVLNHFYDPVRGIGLQGYRTAKEWVSGEVVANSFSWKQAIEAYARGDTEEAYLILGHVLHLIEDMGVPDHTRNDPHPPFLSWEQSPYEYWAMQHKDRQTMSGLGYQYYSEGEKEKRFESLGEYFDFLAKYSNNSFFSKDTIKQTIFVYRLPEVGETIDDYAYGVDTITGKKAKLYILRKDKDGIYTRLLLNQNDDSVLSEYFDRLSRQIIPTGAGVISLFKEEGEKAKKVYEEKEFLVKEEEARKAAGEQKIADAAFLEKPKYWIQYTWDFNVKKGIWESVANIRETTSQTLAFVTQSIFNIGSVISFNTKEAGQMAQAGVNSVTFTQKKTSNAVGPIFAFIDNTSSNSQQTTASIVQNTLTIKPEIQSKAQTNSLPSAPITIFPGFGGGGDSVSLAPASQAVPVELEVSTTTDDAPAVDITPPDINISVPDCAYSLAHDTCVLPVSTTTLLLSSVATDTSSFSVWVDGVLLGSGSSTEAELALAIGQHEIVGTAMDNSGNIATSSSVGVTYVKQPVVISEVAWPGTGVSENNQWLELYNNTNTRIDLSHVTLSSEDSPLLINFASQIDPHQYYLIERDSDDAVPGITADLITSFGPGLLSGGEGLKLVYHKGVEDILLDRTPTVSECEGWCGGASRNFATMTRLGAMGDGGGSANWGTDGHYVRSIAENLGVTILGSPQGAIENPCLSHNFASFNFRKLASVRVDPCF